MREWTISLEDRRQLGGAEYGNPQGRPVLLFHGQPGNRLFHPSSDETRRAGVRLIVPERPGYGLSSFQAGRKLLDWSGDVLAIADHFGIQQFEVIGFSGGGPYALACAYAIPKRLVRVCLVSGAPPMDIHEIRRQMLPLARINYGLTQFAKPLMRLVFQVYWRHARKKPNEFIDMMLKQAPEVDQKVLNEPDVLGRMREVWVENLRVDSYGYVYDAEILMNPWGFELEEITIPVELWWGAQDANVPVVVMEYFAAKLPKCTQNILREAGHFGIFTNWIQILRSEI